MPRLDGTGPDGKGPKTGRGLGNCDDEGRDEESNEDFRRGFGRRPGRGTGRGFSR